jgi:hypothetical protein
MRSIRYRLSVLLCAAGRCLSVAVLGRDGAIGGIVAMAFFLGLGAGLPPCADAASAEGAVSAQAWVESLPDSAVDKALESLWTAVPGAERRTPDAARRSALLGYLSGRMPGVRILRVDAAVPERPAPEAASGFYTEVLPGRTAYVRLGALEKAVFAQLDAAMQDWLRLGIDRVVVDLRASEQGGSLEIAAQIAGRFLPGGVPLFSVRRGVANSVSDTPQPNTWSSPWATAQKPGSRRLLAVLVGEHTAGPAEALASVLKLRGRAVLIGHPTRGEAADFMEIPLGEQGSLRVPVAEPVWPSDDAPEGTGARTLLGSPLEPDIRTGDPSAVVSKVLAAEVREGKVAPFVAELERLRNNEAALVAGRNPELEESIRLARAAKVPAGPAPLRDSGLRAALDFFKGWDVLRPR